METKLIKTDNYLLLVCDDEIKIGDLVMLIDKSGIAKVTEFRKGHIKAISLEQIELAVGYYQINDWKKIIAHLPLNNSPILEGVDLLPALEQEDDVEKLAYDATKKQLIRIFGGESKEEVLDDIQKRKYYYIEGYNKAKEKYQYTEEDMRKAFLSGVGITGEGYNAEYSAGNDPDIETEFGEQADKFIQSLSQPKMPVAFECKMDTSRIPYGDDGWKTIETGTKTTTNSQGQEVLVGKFIY